MKKKTVLAATLFSSILPVVWIEFYVGHCLPTMDPDKGWYVCPFLITCLLVPVALAVFGTSLVATKAIEPEDSRGVGN